MRRVIAAAVLGVLSAASLTLAENARAGAAAAGRKEKLEAAKGVRADAAEKREAAKAKAEEKRAAAKEKRAENREEMQNRVQERREDVVDRREDHQEKRIQHGIEKGYLTEDEVAKLQERQSSIAALESSLTSDGKLTGSEFHQLQQELNDASRSIWSEKHDADGNQMAVYRLDKNVFANSTLTAAMNNPDLTKADAKALLKDFRRTVELKRTLSTGDLSDDERAKLQAEYDDLLNRYFEVRS
jgi:hypothetical protein